jgi:quercetin dioxygenase-like cupin family protein
MRVLHTEEPPWPGSTRPRRSSASSARESSLFIVVEGEGAVLAEGAAPREVSAGTTVWWEQGELHETRSETGLSAIVMEAESLDPAIRAALGTEPPTS